MFHTLGSTKYRPTNNQSNMNISVFLLSIILMAIITTGTAESVRDQAMKYYTECQAERAQASASKPSLSSFGSKGSSMGSMGGFSIDECPKDQETKCDLGCVLKKLGAIKDNQLIAPTTKNMCKVKDAAKKKKIDDAIDACAKKVGTQKNECETGAAVCECVMEYGAYQAFFDSC